jgi:DNA (cytosine-5)-methyltransferase 1
MKNLAKQTNLDFNKKPTKAGDFTFIDLFAGIGGTRLGFESVGGECVFTSEWDKHAQKTYAANFGVLPHGDITKILSDEIPNFDVLLAGFPCQPFSSIGKRQGFKHKTQGTLFYDVARVINDKKPVAFLLENVQGLITHDKGRTLSTITETLEELGYSVKFKVLNSSHFGVPQMRKRLYIVGFNVSLGKYNYTKFAFPQGSPENITNIGDYLESGATGYSISKQLQKNYLFKKDDGRPILIDSSSKGPSKTLVASYHKIQRLTGTFVKDGETGLRLYTQNECKSLMGFPANFQVPVSRTQMYRQFGNSVVVPVISAIANNMKPFILKAKQIKQGNYDKTISEPSYSRILQETSK